jgi:hypothetical protein
MKRIDFLLTNLEDHVRQAGEILAEWKKRNLKQKTPREALPSLGA